MAPFHSVPSSLLLSVAADQWAGPRRGGSASSWSARRLSLHFLFNHRSLRDILPSIYHTQKKSRCSISLRDEGLRSGVDVCLLWALSCFQNSREWGVWISGVLSFTYEEHSGQSCSHKRKMSVMFRQGGGGAWVVHAGGRATVLGCSTFTPAPAHIVKSSQISLCFQDDNFVCVSFVSWDVCVLRDSCLLHVRNFVNMSTRSPWIYQAFSHCVRMWSHFQDISLGASRNSSGTYQLQLTRTFVFSHASDKIQENVQTSETHEIVNNLYLTLSSSVE